MNLKQTILKMTSTDAGAYAAGVLGAGTAFLLSRTEAFSVLGQRVARFIGETKPVTLDGVLDCAGFGFGLSQGMRGKSLLNLRKTILPALALTGIPDVAHFLSQQGYEAGYDSSRLGLDLFLDFMGVAAGYAVGYGLRRYTSKP